MSAQLGPDRPTWWNAMLVKHSFHEPDGNWSLDVDGVLAELYAITAMHAAYHAKTRHRNRRRK